MHCGICDSPKPTVPPVAVETVLVTPRMKSLRINHTGSKRLPALHHVKATARSVPKATPQHTSRREEPEAHSAPAKHVTMKSGKLWGKLKSTVVSTAPSIESLHSFDMSELSMSDIVHVAAAMHSASKPMVYQKPLEPAPPKPVLLTYEAVQLLFEQLVR